MQGPLDPATTRQGGGVPSVATSSLAPHDSRPTGDIVAARRASGIAWARVEDGFHVANRDGVFLGYLDREADGTWLVFDGRSTRVGSGAGLREAMDVLIIHHQRAAQAA